MKDYFGNDVRKDDLIIWPAYYNEFHFGVVKDVKKSVLVVIPHYGDKHYTWKRITNCIILPPEYYTQEMIDFRNKNGV